MQPKADTMTGRGKSPSALKTIGEAAELLNVPQHVLRFWETKFPQIKPLKRNGGRRFYRPEDIETLLLIQHLLYKQGYTIEGARKAFDRDIIQQLRQTFSDVAKGEPANQHNDNIMEPSVAPPPAATVRALQAPHHTEMPEAKALARELRHLSAQLREKVSS
jgi:DNA-binding transcriptional MerR regulator